MPSSAPASIFVSAPDGLRLHVRNYGQASLPALPMVCLPGLARTSADFEALAGALSSDAARPRRVIALDYRGRGRSEYDRDPANYTFHTELADVVAVIAALDCAPAIFVGTSRGGILSMMLAALRPTALAGVVLNDIGPVIEPKGLMRIKGYVGRLPQPRNFEEGADILRRLFSAQFPKLGPEDWLAAARRTFKQEENGRLVSTYDDKLAKTMEGVAFDKPLPALWKEFDALANVPLLAIHGENSDILTPATVKTMRAHHANMETIDIPNQGHAPLLAEADIIARIADFASRCDEAHDRFYALGGLIERQQNFKKRNGGVHPPSASHIQKYQASDVN
jgi:pimeloyl-ACP methyl ester carboxylesterase